MSHEAVEFRIRDARTADLPAVAGVFLACWHSYTGFLPRRLIDMYEQEDLQTMWRPLLRDAASGVAVLVAEGAGPKVVGFIRIGTDPDEQRTGHVYSLYVRPDTQGLGAGRQLLAAAEDRLRRDGRREATLWVFAANAVAQGFYARLGWQPDGGRRVEPQFGEPELRLRRLLVGDDGAGIGRVQRHPTGSKPPL